MLRLHDCCRLLSAAHRYMAHMTRAQLYENCCCILGVDNTADQNTVRRAYIDLVKKVHPDSGLPEASAQRFQEIDEAFRLLQEKFAKNRRGISDDDDEVTEKDFNIRHTAPQHRQYLSNEGIGSGNPFQRQKQYQQVKAMKAQERVFNHRISKSQAGEGSLMKKGSFFNRHAIKTKYGIERVVEDLIQEAMASGDFQNLNGAGKPLSGTATQNPYVDFTTHKMNKILLDNGFTPEWITLQRDIREAVQKLKNALKAERAFLGDYPLSTEDQANWQQVLPRFEHDLLEINKNIDKYNLIVPILQNQLFRLNMQRLSEQILQDPDAPKGFKRHTNTEPHNGQEASKSNAKSDLFSFLGSLF